jgi:ubiquinone/menaquinone biosynthesis C-methylase UbiE
MTNRDERQYWNGEHWQTVWPKRERITDAITPFLFDGLALRPRDRVLDIGSGGGKTALLAARAVGIEGLVVGADISEPLTRLAARRAREAGARNAVFRVLDVQSDPIEGAPFDVAISQFGVMFFDEPVKAFANVRAHLKPSGRIRFACWQSDAKNPWLFRTRIAEFLPPPVAPEPGKSPTGPFSLADPDATARMLERAGFVDVRHSAHELVVEAPRDSLVDDVQLLAAGVPPGRLAEASAAVDAHMAQFGDQSGPSRFPLAFAIFEASRGDAL